MKLEDAITWRKHLWLAPCRFAIGDIDKFRGRKVLDLGSRDGAIAKYFESIGAEVEACDVKESAVKDIVANGIRAFRIDPEWSELPSNSYDFIFTKSVLVLTKNLPAALSNIRRALTADGEYLAVENWTSPLLEGLRYVVNGRKFSSQFSYLNKTSISCLHEHFERVEMKFGPLRVAIGIRSSLKSC